MHAARPQVPLRPPRRPTRRATPWVLAGSAAAGVGAYAFQVVGTRGLGEEAYAPIGVLWTIQYLAMAVPLIAVETYVTRLTARREGAAGAGAPRRPMRVIGAGILLTAALLGLATWSARDALFGGVGDLAAVAAAIVVAYGSFVVVRGQMAGADRFRSYGAATALESLVRLLLAVPVVVLAPHTRALAWVLPVGPLLAVAWWCWDRRGRAPAAGTAQPAGPPPPDRGRDESAVRFLATTTTANGAAQALLAAGPLVLVPLGASPAEISVFFVTVTLARAPLHFALGGLLSRLLPPLTRLARASREDALRRVALQLAGAALAAAGAGAAVAWWLGPDVVALLFGDPFRPGREFAALTATAVLACTGALLLNQVLIARGLETRLLPPWLAGLASAAPALVWVDASPTLAVATASATGAVVALLGLLLALLSVPGNRPT